MVRGARVGQHPPVAVHDRHADARQPVVPELHRVVPDRPDRPAVQSRRIVGELAIGVELPEPDVGPGRDVIGGPARQRGGEVQLDQTVHLRHVRDGEHPVGALPDDAGPAAVGERHAHAVVRDVGHDAALPRPGHGGRDQHVHVHVAETSIGRQLQLGVPAADVGEPVHLVADDPIPVSGDALDRDGVASQAGDEAVALERRRAAAAREEQGEGEAGQHGGREGSRII